MQTISQIKVKYKPPILSNRAKIKDQPQKKESISSSNLTP